MALFLRIINMVTWHLKMAIWIAVDARLQLN